MTIGVLTTSFPRRPGDYAGCFVADDVRRLAAAGDAVEVIAAGDEDAGRHTPSWAIGTRAAALVSEPRSDLGARVTVLRVPAPPRAPGAPALFYGAGAPEALESGGARVWIQAIGAWAGLCEAVRARAHAWDRIVAHWLVPGALAARGIAPALPLTAHAHSGDVALLERLPGGPSLARRIADGASELIFASADLRARFARLCGRAVAGRVPGDSGAWEKISDLGATASAWATGGGAPVRDAVARAVARRELGIVDRTVLSVGRLVPIKGFDILVRAAALAAATRSPAPGAEDPRAWALAPATRFVILGDGPERARLEALARRLNVHLDLPGFVPRPEIARWMTGADLYVQPSRPLANGRTEGLPVATLEALSLGLPVVASATGGLGELATGRGPGGMGPAGPAGLHLVPSGDPLALAAWL